MSAAASRYPGSTRARSASSTTPARTACSWWRRTGSSAFDVIMAEPIPEKGRVLTAMTVFWCQELSDVVPGTQLAVDPEQIRDALGDGRARRVGGPGRAGAPRRHAPDRVHRARVPGRAGLRGVRAHAAPCTARPCLPGSAWPAGWTSPCSLPPPRRTRATISTSISRPPWTWSEPTWRRRRATSAWSSTPGPPRAPPRPGSSWPTPSSSSAGSTGCSASATRCAHRIRRGCGPRTRWSRGPRRRHSTSSRCATGSRRGHGTAGRRLRRCRPT